jgi:hypothetical protein
LGNAVSKGSGTGVFYKNGNTMRLPNYSGLFLRGSGSQNITEYGFSGTHNGGNIGDKHGDAIRNITGYTASDYRIWTHHGRYNSDNPANSAIYKSLGSGYSTDIGDGPSDAGGIELFFSASRVVPTDATNHPAFGVGRICISY